jgi:hypothetical protein
MKKRILQYLVGLFALSAFALADSRPNLLVLLTDDQRWDTLGVYNEDCPIPTPNLDRLANEGIRFDQGFVTTPICAVSHKMPAKARWPLGPNTVTLTTSMSM